MTGLAFFGAFCGALTAVLMVALLLHAEARGQPQPAAQWCMLTEDGQPAMPDFDDTPLPAPMEAAR